MSKTVIGTCMCGHRSDQHENSEWTKDGNTVALYPCSACDCDWYEPVPGTPTEHLRFAAREQHP